MSANDEANEELYSEVRCLLGEFFPNFCFIVMDEDGTLYYDYTNLPVGRMLIREVRDEIESDDFNEEDNYIVDFEGEEEDTEGEEWKNS